MHITIIGAGVIGLSTAYYLQETGHEVTIIDKGDGKNNCSFGNAGYISPSHFIPLASPYCGARIEVDVEFDQPPLRKAWDNASLIKWG
ncbi:MAG: FAD-dependent oxidoreductase [Saprospiraceae bacterium]|nr:FAD-dependent oxidoreductase [Saprospiraceae bacterium]